MCTDFHLIVFLLVLVADDADTDFIQDPINCMHFFKKIPS